ncbi:response regulator transcription factor [Planosporangium thailandense]|uniref:Response regulator transcription factor n=1 Tax=Planosporangium thailandense TaxID=765197 RepID=A0ABX0Y3V0_9ACTN|nr:response regulator transcription factor [Planosporangium thailandense]
MTRVLIVEDMLLTRGALVALLAREPDIEVVAELGTDARLVALAGDLRPDVVVMSADQVTNDVLATVAELQDTVRETAILILVDPRKPVILPSRRPGRMPSYLVKDVPPGVLAETIRRVAGGEWVMDPRVAVAAMRGTQCSLTTRELEVLGLAAEGASVAEIALRLLLAPGTVRNHLSKAIAKTGARNRIDAIRIAQEAGWLR